MGLGGCLFGFKIADWKSELRSYGETVALLSVHCIHVGRFD